MPFGEVFIEERNNNWNTPYLFNGKELDEETGSYYYGARYYNPRESIFISVDPLFEKTGTPYQYTYQNPIRFTDPTGMEGEEVKEPPIKEIRYFRDNTGEYFWNKNQDAYEHYSSGQDGYSYYEGMYSVDESKKPVGDYSMILQDGKEGELAIKDIVEERNYTDVSREDVGRTITLEYSSRNQIRSEVFAREKGEKNVKILRNSQIEPRSKSDIISGITVKTKTYIETRDYGSSFNNSTTPTTNDAKNDMIKFGAEKLVEFLQSLIKKR
nr:RHS repeat-associated core domain-containing protein [uncultured Apibacter sp.]